MEEAARTVLSYVPVHWNVVGKFPLWIARGVIVVDAAALFDYEWRGMGSNIVPTCFLDYPNEHQPVSQSNSPSVDSFE